MDDTFTHELMGDGYLLKYLSRCLYVWNFLNKLKKIHFPSWPMPPQLWTIKMTSNICSCYLSGTLIFSILVSLILFLKYNYGPLSLFVLIVGNGKHSVTQWNNFTYVSLPLSNSPSKSFLYYTLISNHLINRPTS